MPKRTDIKSIFLIGSGPIVIGQACEFDYSGSQACKALKEEGYRIILINSNPATIMTDPTMADRTYVEPLIPEVLEAIIKAERPDALLPTLGGQTGLNLATVLSERGILEKYHVELIGADYAAIKKAEDREEFKAAMEKIGLEVPRSGFAYNLEQARKVVKEIGFPAIITAQLYPGRHRRCRRLQHRGIRGARRQGHREQHDQRDPHRGIGHRLEGVRAGGDAGQEGQRGHRLFHREPRSHGRPYGRQHHRCTCPDPDRQGIPGDAGRGHRHHPGDRCRDGRIQHPVCRQS